jgi:hypothetical protein
MAQSVKLSDDIMAYVRKESARQSRSVAGQITHFIRIARVIEKSGTFDYQRIDQVLAAELSPDELTSEEQAVWFDQFATQMTRPSQQEKAFYKKRRKLGRGVGMKSSGELDYPEAQSA